jgi:hypothetical protein
MPDEAILKHNRDANCLERQTSAAMFGANYKERLFYQICNLYLVSVLPPREMPSVVADGRVDEELCGC